MTVQQLIDDWHLQARTHAALQCPSIPVLQAGRFSFDVHSERVSKLKYELVPDRSVVCPVFSEGLHVEHIRFQLCTLSHSI